MTVADRETFLALRRALPAATKPCLRETFGVSETTWVKLRDGRPVKASTLERVLARYRGLCGHAESRAAGGQERAGRMPGRREPAGLMSPALNPN
jgi:D-tyrosyl-tRNA(Tyr) deacylase